jgi:hypothetical protein
MPTPWPASSAIPDDVLFRPPILSRAGQDAEWLATSAP